MNREQSEKWFREELDRRQATAPTRLDNSKLYAGMPMVYYCRECGHIAAVLHEEHREAPPRRCCFCEMMSQMGLTRDTA